MNNSVNRIDELESYIRHLENCHVHELNEKQKEIDAYKEELNVMRYAFKGACHEHLHFKYEISAIQINQRTNHENALIDALTRNTLAALSSAIEERLGGRYKLEKDLDDAKRYIHYLTNHAAAGGIQFTPYEVRKSD